MAYHYKKKRYKLKPLPIFLALLILGLIIFFTIKLFSPSDNKDKTQNTAKVSSSQAVEDNNQSDSTNEIKDNNSDTKTTDTEISLPEGSKSDWNLILLNPDEENKIDKELDIEKTKFDTQWVDSRAAQAYKDMYDAAKKENITLYLRSGYRSMATQKRNYDNEVARQMNLGNSKEEAIRLTQEYYTVPGHSEHHTALAFDIITPQYHNDIYTLSERFAETKAYEWLKENCSDYGFILRYTKEKKDITKINFEPWHYRYVGVEHAKYMEENNLCLEEYLALFNE